MQVIIDLAKHGVNQVVGIIDLYDPRHDQGTVSPGHLLSVAPGNFLRISWNFYVTAGPTPLLALRVIV
jgi:hypothetical protein